MMTALVSRCIFSCSIPIKMIQAKLPWAIGCSTGFSSNIFKTSCRTFKLKQIVLWLEYVTLICKVLSFNPWLRRRKILRTNILPVLFFSTQNLRIRARGESWSLLARAANTELYKPWKKFLNLGQPKSLIGVFEISYSNGSATQCRCYLFSTAIAITPTSSSATIRVRNFKNSYQRWRI